MADFVSGLLVFRHSENVAKVPGKGLHQCSPFCLTLFITIL